jgi:hypothetical protein
MPDVHLVEGAWRELQPIPASPWSGASVATVGGTLFASAAKGRYGGIPP